jgi:hypothetical protein
MNPQEILNQNIRMLIGDLQVNLMMANARIQELEAQLAVHADAGLPEAPEAPAKTNGKAPRADPLVV